jgi:hypothetical protein
MSYNISILGHKDGVDSEQFEREVCDKAREFVASLDGVASATFKGGVTGLANLVGAADANTES